VEYLKLKAGKYSQIDADYQQNLWKLNEIQLFETEGQAVQLKIKSVDENGLLVTENEQGETLKFKNGELVYLD